jgi:hypothetical protein
MTSRCYFVPKVKLETHSRLERNDNTDHRPIGCDTFYCGHGRVRFEARLARRHIAESQPDGY